MYKFSSEDVPKVLSIYPDKDSSIKSNTLLFFQQIEIKVYKENERLLIDLSMVEKVTAMAAVLFFAIVNRAQLTLKDSKVIQFIWPSKEHNIKGHQNIIRSGLSSALQAGTFERLVKLTEQQRYFQSSVIPDQQLIQTRKLLIDKIEPPLNDVQLSLLSGAIGEAMINVKHHAYKFDMKNSEQHLGGSRWWQCSWYNEAKDELHFIICDLGCGINNSYTHNLTPIEKELSREVDNVKEALTEGFSRFIDEGRGNGSEDIKRPIENSCIKSDLLFIYTGYVVYFYRKKDNEPKILCERVSQFIPGTIIEWCMELGDR